MKKVMYTSTGYQGGQAYRADRQAIYICTSCDLFSTWQSAPNKLQRKQTKYIATKNIIKNTQYSLRIQYVVLDAFLTIKNH